MSEQNTYAKKPTRATVWDDSRLGWLGCSWFVKFGAKSIAKLQHRFRNDGALAWQASRADLISTGMQEKTADEFLAWREKIVLKDLSENLDREGVDFVLPWENPYPVVLKQSSCPPSYLFWRGAPITKRPWIAVVGTRKMSAYGKRAATQITSELSLAGAGIVSGLALGIDSVAHQTALDNQAQTVAVLAGGIDNATIYPPHNKKLAEQILMNGGAIISEFPPGTSHLRHHFPQRNRIIATLAQAVVVIEAGLDSGSVLTAKLALDENRDVFAVPGPYFSPGSQGTHELLRQGAQICTSGKDVLAEAKAKPETMAVNRPLTDEERRILDLSRTATHIDELTRMLNSSAAVIGATCTTLEMMDALEETEPQTYQLTNKGRQWLLFRPSEMQSDY